MTSLAQKKKGYILPAVIDDGTRYCVTIQVPTDPNHIRAFWGALYELANAWNWAWDGNKTGSTVAFLWQDLVDEAFTLMTYEECMDFCQRVADCLTNNENTRNALANAIRDLFPEIDKPSPTNPVNPTLPILPPPVGTCDLDKLWGQCVSIITRMNTNNKDFLEAYSSDNFLKLVSEAIQLIPAVDALALDDWLRLNQEIAQYGLTSYLAYETDEVLLDLQCLLFCLSRDNCSINIQGLADIFNQSFNTVIDLSSLGSALQFFIDVVTGDFTDRKIFEALWCIQLIGVVYGLPFFQTTQTDVLLYAALGNDTPSPDWALLCDCGWEYFHDFEVSDGGWVGNPYNGYTTANYVAGVGWDDVYFQDAGIARGLRGAWIKYTFSALTTITFVEATFTKTNGMTAIPSATTDIRSESPSFVVLASEPWIDATSPITHLGDIETNNLLILVRCGVRNTNVATDPGGDAKIKTVRVRGTGINPFI